MLGNIEIHLKVTRFNIEFMMKFNFACNCIFKHNHTFFTFNEHFKCWKVIST